MHLVHVPSIRLDERDASSRDSLYNDWWCDALDDLGVDGARERTTVQRDIELGVWLGRLDLDRGGGGFAILDIGVGIDLTRCDIRQASVVDVGGDGSNAS